jgi:hypothetical protein
MDAERRAKREKRTAFFVLWGAGLVGVGSFLPVVAGVLSQLPKSKLPLPLLLALGGAQNALFVAGASAVVVHVGRPIGLRTPAVEAWAEGRPVGRELARVLGPGLALGVLGAAFATLAAPELVAYLCTVSLPARLLYGGIVEELILRGGLMTLLAWGAHRIFQRQGGPLRPGVAAVAVTIANAVFAAGHLPMLHMSHVPSPGRTALAIFVVALPWGWLYFRRGLEAAVTAHASFHAVVAAVAALRG